MTQNMPQGKPVSREKVAVNQKNTPIAAAERPVDEDMGSPAEHKAVSTLWADMKAWGSEDLASDLAVIDGQHVTLHTIALPVRGASRKAAALPFALEGVLGTELEVTHVAYCGEAGASKDTLAAVISAEVMAAAIDQRPETRITAEPFLLATPEPDTAGAEAWHCVRRGARVLVRTSDGTGFAAETKAMPTLWHLAGKPQVEAFGDPLPSGIDAQHHPDAAPPLSDPASLPDLRQGRFRPDRRLDKPLKWLAAACVLGAVGHLGIAAADVQAQKSMADNLRDKAQAALAQRLPDVSPDASPALVQRQLAAQDRVAIGSGFLPLMNRVSTALLSGSDEVQFRQITWAEDTLRLTVEAPGLEALQRAEAELKSAGLRVTSGSASAEDGSARAELTVRP